MARFLILSLAFIFLFINLNAQEKETFTITKEIKHLPVISQGSSGTCWSFATTSFLEAEVIRKGLPKIDLSEMYFVYYAYFDRAEQYLFYHGHNNFSQGGQAHDVFNAMREHGVSTIEDFPGIKTDGRFQDRDLVNELNIEVSNLNKQRDDFDASNLKSLEPILKNYIGKIPKKVEFENNKFTPHELLKEIEINPDDYIEISSFTHHPFYQPFVLEVPDNWAHGLYYNLPMEEMLEVVKYSLDNGYTVCWDGDTSEKTFQHRSGKADVPEKLAGKITQEMRQETFYNRTTTDDHLMHIVGLSKDAEGKTCFYTKNSWGADSNSYGGYLHLTEDYVRLKTIAIVVNKEAIPNNIRRKLNL
jgi:bleomycin hydrolase